MDGIIKRYKATPDADLMLCLDRGVAYQKDMRIQVPYDESYFNKCLSYEDKQIAKDINWGRVNLVSNFVGGADVLDVGIGSGEFIRKREEYTGAATYGYDINPKAIEWLKARGRLAQAINSFESYTFWDVLEHVEVPNNYFKNICDGAHVFVSIPVFDDLRKIRESKHYRPGEHLYYWTKDGFVNWMAEYRFECLAVEDYEMRAGRENIWSFAFSRTLPGYQATIGQYQKLHGNVYGASAKLYLEDIAPTVIALNPGSILDYGCGHSDLSAHFWNDGRRLIHRYDPAIPEYKRIPPDRYGLVLCCDVMEHIRMEDVDRVFNEIKTRSNKVLFTISMRPARALLPDGRNAHVTLLNADEWLAWIREVFGTAERVKSTYDHILIVKTF